MKPQAMVLDAGNPPPPAAAGAPTFESWHGRAGRLAAEGLLTEQEAGP